MYGFPRTSVREPIARRPQYTFEPRAYGALAWWMNALLSPVVPTDSPPAITSLRDLSGNGRTLTPFTPTRGYLIADGWEGWPVISLGPAAYLGGMPPITGAASRTMAIVACPTARDDAFRSMISFGTSAGNGLFALGMTNSNLLSLNNASSNFTSSSTPSLGVPALYGATYDGTILRIYINGSVVHAAAATMNTGSGGLGLGYRTSYNDLIGGYLTWDAMIWSTAISEATMAAMAADLRAMYRF